MAPKASKALPKADASQESNEEDNMENNSAEKASRAVWTSAEEAKLVDVLMDNTALQAESGWKKSVWTTCTTALKEGFPEIKPAKGCTQCKNRWERMKGEYKLIKWLRNQSGFGWNAGKQTVTADDEVWAALMKPMPLKKKLQPFQKKAFPLFDTLGALVDGVMAQGSRALIPGNIGGNEARAAAERDAMTALASKPAEVEEEEEDDEDHDDDEGDTDSLETNTIIKSSDIDPSLRNTSTASSATPTPRSGTPASSSRIPTKRKRATAAGSLDDMTAVLSKIGETYSQERLAEEKASGEVPPSPVRRKTAIQQVEKDGCTDQQVAIAGVIFKDVIEADMYMSMSRETARKIWLGIQIDEYEASAAARRRAQSGIS
ncbi:hypothetical protein SISSUDRAFT_1098751 [Sistotremastrum suecicum HHB10207 ss-3]|uniref:Myb-like domain-containing protein n=1 Tax=Sistotremastrum suecicum HHB10207 ss-3 TaxID=1314776 RepID=A0A166E8G8_9AGAM|nr:hypothetical protein SISSUDRAFT_1098751 [Sistotremastrum suecicum HHB10207 ss-3]